MSLPAIPQNLKDLGTITLPTVAASALYRMGVGRWIEQRGVRSDTVKLGNAILGFLAVGTTLYKFGQFCLREKRDPKKTPLQKILKVTLMGAQVAVVLSVSLCVAKPLPPVDDNPTPPGAWRVHIKGRQHGVRGQMDGPCDGKKVLAKLVGHPNLPSGVMFEEHRLDKDLRFGTCSAMSLDFAEEILTKCEGKSDEAVVECLKGIGKKFQTSGRKYRDIQSALNTIGVVFHRESDLMLKKVKALACYWDLKIPEAIPTNLPPDFGQPRLGGLEIVRDIEIAPNGVYLVRAIQPGLFSRKAERYGHSTLVFKLGEAVRGYYDPNRGLLIADSLHMSLTEFATAVRDFLAQDAEEFRLSVRNAQGVWKRTGPWLAAQRLYRLEKMS